MKQIHVFTIFSTPQSFFDGQFKYLVDQGEEIILVSSDNENACAFAERNKIRFIPVEMPRALSLGAILNAIKCLCVIIKREHPDVVFGHTPVGALCAMIAAKLCGVRNRIYYRHGVIYTTMKGLKRTIFKMEEQFVAALATSVVNVSHSLSRLAERDRLNPANKQYVIGHGTCGGIDAVNIFNPALIDKDMLNSKRSFWNLQDADIVFGYCGRICNDKGTPELVDGFKLFQKRHPALNAKLLLIGRFDSRDGVSTERQAMMEANKDIVITGYIEKAEIPYYYSMLDAFIFPSHREGFGMVAIEASAMEKPLLVSKAHGVEDTIVEHVTGEYIDLTPESICHGMESMLDEDTRKALGENGRKKVMEWYDFRVMWPLVKELYVITCWLN